MRVFFLNVSIFKYLNLVTLHSGMAIGKALVVINFPNVLDASADAEFDFSSREKVVMAKVKSGNAIMFEFLTSIEWSLEASNIVVRAVFNKEKMELKLKRVGLKQISWNANIFGTVVTFDCVNEFRSMDNFGIKARLSGSPGIVPKMAFTLRSETVSDNAVLLTDGKLEFNQIAVTFDLDHKRRDVLFDFNLKSDQLPYLNGKVAYALKNDGKALTIEFARLGTVTIFENISRNAGQPMNLKYDNSFTGNKGSLTFDLAEQKGSIAFSDREEQYSSTIEAEVHMVADGFNVIVKGTSKLLPKPFNAELKVVFPFTWQLTFNMMESITLKGSMKEDFSHGQLSFVSSSIDAELTVVNQDEVKAVDFTLGMGEYRMVELNAKIVPGVSLLLNLKSPLNEDLSFYVENSDDSSLKLQYGDDLLVKFEKTSTVISLHVEYASNLISGKYGFGDQTLELVGKANGQEVRINCVVKASGISIKITEPFTSSGQIVMDGNWSITDKGPELKGSASFQVG